MTSINVLGIYNNRTHEGFTTIQNAINDNDTLNGDIITLNDGIYTENVVVNKTITIRPVDDNLVTITGSDPSLTIFNITSSGSGSSINGLTLMGSEDSHGVFLNATNNCNIAGNVIKGNDIGIYLYLSSNNTIQGNSLIDNNYALGLHNSTNNVLSGNYLTGNDYGIYLKDSNYNIIIRNNLTGNDYGIYLKDSNYNIIIRNNLTDNWEAINLVTSNNNSILNNTINDSWIGNYLYLSNNTVISGNNFEENGVGICYYDSNNTSFSGNNFAGNWIKDVSEIDSSNMVIATSIYTCGPAALATVMMHMGLNATEEDLANWAGTDDTGTSMFGLVQAANKTGLTAYGFRLSIDQLKTDYIVVLRIYDNNHYAIIQNITNTTVYLIDPNLGNIEMNLTEFTNVYTGKVLVINNTTAINGTLLDNDTMNATKGKDWWGAVVNAVKKSPIGKAVNGFCKYVKSTPIGKVARKIYHNYGKSGKVLKKYLGSKKQYLVKDGIDTLFFGVSILSAKVPKGKSLLTRILPRLGYVGIVVTGCQLLNDFRDHYVPMKSWQYFHHPSIWNAKTYTLCHRDISGTPIWNEPTIQVEVPYKGDGSLDWNNAVYIHSVTGAKKVSSTQLKELTKGYWWNNLLYCGFTRCPIP